MMSGLMPFMRLFRTRVFSVMFVSSFSSVITIPLASSFLCFNKSKFWRSLKRKVTVNRNRPRSRRLSQVESSFGVRVCHHSFQPPLLKLHTHTVYSHCPILWRSFLMVRLVKYHLILDHLHDFTLRIKFFMIVGNFL